MVFAKISVSVELLFLVAPGQHAGGRWSLLPAASIFQGFPAPFLAAVSFTLEHFVNEKPGPDSDSILIYNNMSGVTQLKLKESLLTYTALNHSILWTSIELFHSLYLGYYSALELPGELQFCL